MADELELTRLRSQFELQGLDESEVTESPIQQFENWFAVAKKNSPGKWFEPNAMTLATSDGRGNMSARIVLLKDFAERGFLFFSNYESDKGKNLAANPSAALTFHWPYLARQVRIIGQVEKSDRQTSDEYFHSRPRGSQVSASASDQSSPVVNRAELERRFAEIDQLFAGEEIPLPDYWGGYWLTPTSIEFWQGRASRLHDRIQYQQHNDQWTISRLSP